jgi:hypothetical protein
VVGVLLLGIAAMINAVDDFVDSRQAESERERLSTRVIQLNDELRCRFLITQPVEDAQAQVQAVSLEKLDALARGLSATVRDDPDAVAREAERIDALITMGDEARTQLELALQDRAEAVQDCRREGEPEP